jgi:hypothetical protein
MKEALSSSETSVLTSATRRNIPEDALLPEAIAFVGERLHLDGPWNARGEARTSDWELRNNVSICMKTEENYGSRCRDGRSQDRPDGCRTRKREYDRTVWNTQAPTSEEHELPYASANANGSTLFAEDTTNAEILCHFSERAPSAL